jgi:PAS domain S-box-containing protein
MNPRGGGVIRWLSRYRMGLAFVLVAGLLLAIGIIAFSARALVERQETVRHITQVLAELDGVLSAVVDAEAAQRGLLMTGDRRYLASYAASIGPVDDRFNALRALTGDDPRRRQQLDALERLITSRLAELRETERIRGERGIEEARRHVRTGRGLYLSDQIWTMISALKAEERRRLTEESGRHAAEALRVFLVLTGLAGAAVLVLAALVIESRRRAGEIRATRDVLQSQVAEHAQTSALLASIVQSTDAAIIGLGPDGRVLTWNAGAERLYGYQEDETRDRPIATLCPGPQQQEVSAHLERVVREQAVERLECGQVTREGRRIHVFMTISPIRDVGGAVVGASIVARDITAAKAAEESLRRTEATSRAFLESASESVLIVDAAGRIVLVNARTEKLFGYARGEVIGQPVEMLIPAALRERHVAHRATYMAAPRVRSMGQGLDLAGLRKDGTEFPVEVSLSFVETDEGVRVIAFVTDISERVAFQRAARQADKLAALGTLSAGIAHEINNPIGIITSRVEVMLLEADEAGLSAEMRKDLEVILRHARRVATITQGLLSFARQSSGMRKPVNLNQVAEEIVQLARKDMSRARVEVTLKLQESLPPIVADANAIGQVLLNLLTNARRAMPEGGEITIETSHLAAARAVRLAVRDTGSGIPPEILPKIFDPFFTTKPDGTGLGLSISHGIVHDHHGSLDVRSEVGKGSTFTLTFPLDGAPAA